MKFVSVFVCLLLLASFVFADNQVKITQLQTENQVLTQEINNIQTQAQQMIQDRQVQILKNQGKIELLQEQDINDTPIEINTKEVK